MLDWYLVLVAIVVAAGIYRTVSAHKRMMSSFTPEVRATLEVAKRARKLRRTDPAAAERLILDHAEEQGREEARNREQLRSRAATDPEAAADLQRRLEGDLEAIAASRRFIEKEYRRDPKGPRLLRQADDDQAKVEAELKQLAKMLGRG